jgi:hypothetical protein
MAPLDDPSALRLSLRRNVLKAGVKAGQRLAGIRGTSDAVDVMDEEWDNLFILDACRYDVFERHHEFPGTLQKRRSGGSHSVDFIRHNFVGRECHDTVYVTGNPFAVLATGVFYATVNLFDDAWDEELLTVPPEPVVEAAIEANDRHPDKRLIVHFMQPHYPFIGERGRRIDSGGVTGHVAEADVETKTERTYSSVWEKLDLGQCDVPSETVWEAYLENFRLVAGSAATLADHLDGKTVITADHGNLFGERLSPIPVRKYGHPKRIRHPALIDVPWHELPVEGRREVESHSPEGSESVEEEVVEERLEALGYA